MTIEELEKLIKKNCQLKKVNVLDLSDGCDEEDIDVFVDTYSTNISKAEKIVDYLTTLGFSLEIGNGYTFLPTEDKHPEWLIVHATKLKER